MYFCSILNLLNFLIKYQSMETHQNLNDVIDLIGICFRALIVHRSSRSTSEVFKCLVYCKFVTHISICVEELVSKGELVHCEIN